MDKVKHQYQELQHFFFLSYSGTILVTCNTSFFIFFYFFSLPGNFCLFTISALKPKYRRSSTWRLIQCYVPRGRWSPWTSYYYFWRIPHHANLHWLFFTFERAVLFEVWLITDHQADNILVAVVAKLFEPFVQILKRW